MIETNKNEAFNKLMSLAYERNWDFQLNFKDGAWSLKIVEPTVFTYQAPGLELLIDLLVDSLKTK